MIQHDHPQQFLQFVDKIGYDIGPDTAENLTMYAQKSFDFFPELAMFTASYLVKKTFTRQTTAPKFINRSICFFFKNMISDDDAGIGERSRLSPDDKPFIRVFPSTHTYTSLFKENSRVVIVAVLVQADYLKSFLGDDADQFQFLLDTPTDFLLEEVMTDDMISTLNSIARKEPPGLLPAYYYRLKAMELLFYLFQRLSKREKTVQQTFSEQDIVSIYKVRDQLVSCLAKPSSISELTRVAGMNALKMRTLFKQVFGQGIYDYYQHVRMQEAARLLRIPNHSVAEVGSQLGYENLSHFSRVFEKHIGQKPKKFSTSAR
ncbi:helix-turn-helix transcriptional regulator [Spirosoma radiotolerans]|uniref:HTH araC/xylS-type domain-containing protein n=1 Tax=Spirosoma radiotolerans TaxID=1379870 RepID=A0A0E3V6X1_9BACT|nr:helix-turn-helix transcriptional regulator [Spirosoma radiotolerans]AKD54901.1 hypothetical protein SD10_08310 [Spirosoma radiotolerans]